VAAQVGRRRGQLRPLSAPACPSSGLDLWSDAVLADPYPTFAELRAAGPVVWLERHGLAALPRYDEVHATLADWRRFSSARGVGVGELGNGLGESVIASDPPVHSYYRKPLADQLSTSALTPDLPGIQATAGRFAEDVTRRGIFDAVADLARPYSLTVVADLLGLPEAGREDYPGLAERAFNIFGPDGPRPLDAMGAFGEIVQRTRDVTESGALVPGGRGEELCRMGRPFTLISYMWPGVDTTVNALSSAVALFADHPDQWEAVRADRSLIPAAFQEVLRLHAPVHYFTRRVTEDVDVAGVRLDEGTRVLVMYGSANRDDRRFPDPDRFDVRRDAGGQLAFGRGVHLCVGIHLARLEAHALLNSLADRVARFEPAGTVRWQVNNTLHGPAEAPVRAIPA
jgi:cytochrome P450